jgi:Na+:H+ antiporter, NhaA family
MKPVPRRRPASALRSVLQGEAGGGLVLMAAAAAALAMANSPFAPAYFGVLNTKAGGLSLLHWINDALMALFFLLVGLEIKREFLDGQPRHPGRRRACADHPASALTRPAR